MNWLVLLKDAYDGNGFLIEKDPQVVFNEKLYKYAQVDHMEPRFWGGSFENFKVSSCIAFSLSLNFCIYFSLYKYAQVYVALHLKPLVSLV